MTVDTTTGEIVETLTRVDAERLTNRIRLGATDRTVRRDMTGGTDVPPAPKVAAGARGEGDGRVESRFESEAPSPTPPAPVIGLDGKTYTRPEPIDHEADLGSAVAS